MNRIERNWLLWTALIVLHSYGMVFGVVAYHLMGFLGVFIGAYFTAVVSFLGVLFVNKLENSK